MSRASLVEPSLLRLAGSVITALIAGVFVASFDAHVAARDQGAAFSSVAFASVGLILPLALVVGLLTGAGLCAFLPDSARGDVRAWLSDAGEGTRAAERSVRALLFPLAFVLWLLIVARWALFALAAELAPSAAGVAVSLGALALGAVLVTGADALAVRAAATSVPWPRPRTSLALSLALCVAVLLFAVFTGAPSGSGSFLGMWGVLTRDELDLRALAELLLLVAAAAWFEAPRTWRTAALAPLLTVVSLALTLHVARQGLETAATRLAIERSAPLGSRLLPPLRRLSDRDRDGYAIAFGGGDCDDTRADVNPAANDIPGNALDEDCSGADARPVVEAATKDEATTDLIARARARLSLPLNVILLTVDTLRYDLGYAGNPRPISPELDRLAAESVIFERAYALASYTAKSLPPMLIGRYSSETHRGYSHFNRFEKSDLFLPERLQRAGVRTVSVQGHWYFFQNYGMERGFDVLNSSPAPRAAQVAEGDRSVTSERVSDAVLSELKSPELANKPFFLWAHYTDPHAEYVEHPGIDFGRGARAAYDGEVAFVDRELGRVLAALRQSPLWSRTAVIVTSDHGEAFGEHGMIRHGFELWEELVRVPFLIRVPGVDPRRISARRSTIDVVPTILELMGVAAEPDALSGVSLLGELAAPVDYRAPERSVFIDMAEGPYNAERRALIEGDKKLVLSGGRPLGLFDLASDPAEKRDLSGDKAELSAMMERYRAFRGRLKEVPVRPPR